MQNNFPPKYNSGIAAKTLSILEILLTLVKGVQPYEILKKKKEKEREKNISFNSEYKSYLTVGALNKLKLNLPDFVHSSVQFAKRKNFRNIG